MGQWDLNKKYMGMFFIAKKWAFGPCKKSAYCSKKVMGLLDKVNNKYMEKVMYLFVWA